MMKSSIAITLLFAISMNYAHAENNSISVAELVKALAPQQQQINSSVSTSGTRDINVEAMLAEDETPQENTTSAVLTAPPAINLSIPFVINKSTLTLQGQSMVNTIAEALQTPQLQSHQFLIEGHTDQSGQYQLNQKLSQQRAERVRQALIQKGIAAGRLVAVGRASDDLLNKENPLAAENRRVKFVLIK